MAVCTSCGAILHNQDVDKHRCKAFNLPDPGKVKQPKTTEVVEDDRR